MSFRKSVCFVFFPLALFLYCGCSSGVSDKGAYTAKNVADGSILHCFCWDFNTIKNSMADIAAAGFSAVQTSPANLCYEGDDGGMDLFGDGKWYYHYQPVDWKIGNYQLGTRDEFRDMCAEADAYGIKVIVDVVPNHTTPVRSAVSRDLIVAAGGVGNLYHAGAKNGLSTFADRLKCTTYSMGGLPDVNTENPGFQKYFFAYLNDLVECGADGFRFDTAKHIGLPDDPKEDDGYENNFWPRMKASVTGAKKLFMYGEVLQGSNERFADYVDAIGAATASAYGIKLRSAVLSGKLSASTLENFFAGGETRRLVTWVESHDNYINDGNWAVMDEDQVVMGYAVIAARSGGTPLFFSRPYGANRQNRWGEMNRIGCAGSDAYKDPRVRALNFFRIAMAGTEERFSDVAGGSVLIIERGNKGAVVINAGGETAVDFPVGLRDGVYTDRVDGKTEFSVKDGKLSASLPLGSKSIAVLCGAGYAEPAAQIYLGVEGSLRFHDGAPAPVVLRAENAAASFYSLNGSDPKPFGDGDGIEVPRVESLPTTLTLTATGSEGQTSFREFVFTDSSDES